MDLRTRPFACVQQIARDLYTRHEPRGARTWILVYAHENDRDPLTESVSYRTVDTTRMDVYGTRGDETVADAADRCARYGAALRLVAAMREADEKGRH